MKLLNKNGEEVEMTLIKVEEIPEDFDFSTCVNSMRITELEVMKANIKTAIRSNKHPEKIDFYTDSLVKIMTAIYIKTCCISYFEAKELADKSLLEARSYKPKTPFEPETPLRTIINEEIKAKVLDKQLILSCFAFCKYQALYNYSSTLEAAYSSNSYSDNGPQKIIN